MKRSLSNLGFWLILVTTVRIAPAAAPSPKTEPLGKLTVHLFDADHKPVLGAHVGTFCGVFVHEQKVDLAMHDANGFRYADHCLSDKDGVAKLAAKTGDLANYRGKIRLIARHDGRGLIALADLDAAHLPTPVELTLVPECRVTGNLSCPELAKLGRKVDWTNVYLNIGTERMMSCTSESGEFYFFVPPGRYDLNAYGTYLNPKDVTLTVPDGKRAVQLDLTLSAKRFALLQGHQAPELRDIAAWKNGPPLKLADLKGKCVVLEFWGHWCGPCVHRMPLTVALYDRFHKQGLVVIGVHVEYSNADVDSVEKLDAKLVKIRKDLWHNRDLPFPVAVARPQKKGGALVAEDYGVNSFPTTLLIDHHGKIVDIFDPGPESVALLQKSLDEKPDGQTAALKSPVR
jgi:thiol-disulfide isomerase/thioredoxin